MYDILYIRCTRDIIKIPSSSDHQALSGTTGTFRDHQGPQGPPTHTHTYTHTQAPTHTQAAHIMDTNAHTEAHAHAEGVGSSLAESARPC